MHRRFPILRQSLVLGLLLSCATVLNARIEGKDREPLRLHITCPGKNDTINYDKVRIAGYTNVRANVFLWGERIQSFPNNAFVGRVDLRPGMNYITVKAESGARTANDLLLIYREPPIAASPTRPTTMDSVMMEPSMDIWATSGDYVQVQLKGSPNGRAFFTIPGLTSRMPMQEDTTELHGLYRGTFRFVEGPREKIFPVEFELHGEDGRRFKKRAAGGVKLLRDNLPLIGSTTDEAKLFNAPIAGAVLGTLPGQIRLQVVGRLNGRYKIKLSRSQTVYIDEQNLASVAYRPARSASRLSTPEIRYNGDWIELKMNVDHREAFLIEQDVLPSILDLYVYNAYIASQWTTLPNGPSLIKSILWSQPEENVVKLRIELGEKQSWGYRIGFVDGQMILYVRRPPRLSGNSLRGLVIAVDAGHGGEEEGAISPTGIEEKDLNLKLAGFLANKLRKAGAEVLLTRNADTTLTLQQRIKTAKSANANMFISLHNNSAAEYSDPLLARGTSTYFTLPQNKALGWAVYRHLTQLGLQPFGRTFTSFYVTRETSMLVLMVEGAFLSNPLDEQKLSNDGFLMSMANAIRNGIAEFVRDQR